jgi:hypothetical protein
MSIYTRYGETVQIIDTRFVPLWIERRRGEIKVHHTKPTATKRTVSIEETVGWFVRLINKDGHQLLDGKWIDINTLVADDGIRELNDTFAAMMGPQQMAKFSEWNKRGAPTADTFWPLLPEKQSA